jgi:hypothetical protein
MSDFTCSKCNYVSNIKQNVVKHIRTKKCWINDSDEPTISKIIKEVNCEYCNNMFDTVMGLHKHVKSQCKIKRELDKKKESDVSELDKLKEKVKELELKIDKQSEVISINTTNINDNSTNSVNNTIIVVNNPVVLMAYNDEDMITNDIIRKCIPRKFASVEYMIKHIHLDPTRPERHNIYITNKRENDAYVYTKQGMWELVKKMNSLMKSFRDMKDIWKIMLIKILSILRISRCTKVLKIKLLIKRVTTTKKVLLIIFLKISTICL